MFGRSVFKFRFAPLFCLLIPAFCFLSELSSVYAQANPAVKSKTKTKAKAKAISKPSRATPSRARTPAQNALVQTEGAAVYQQPNFDAPVIDYLKAGQKVVISKKSAQGIGGLGIFFRIRTPAGKMGYIADVDVIPEFSQSKYRTDEKVTNPEFQKAKTEVADRKANRPSIYLTRYLGGHLGILSFSEKFSGQTLKDNVTMFGFRMTGPGVLFDGPPFDLNIQFSPTVPGYYLSFASAPPSGFFFHGDFMPILPALETTNGLLYYGLGLMWTYTKFNVLVRNTTFDSQELRVGLAGGLGYGQRFNDWILRADIKYYYEKTAYPGYGLSLQRQY